MKILIAAGIWKPELGGPAAFGAELAERLAARGDEIRVLTYVPHGIKFEEKAAAFPIVRIKRTGNKLANYWRYFTQLWHMLLREKPDVVYMLDWFTVGVPGMVACKLRGQKYIVRVGGGYIWEKYLNQGKPGMPLAEFYERGLHKSYWLMYLLIGQVLRGARMVIFNSDQQRILYQKQYGLKPERTTTIYNAVPKLERLPVQSPGEKRKEIVFAGRFVGMKNVGSLVRAFAQLKDHSFKLVLIGEGPEEQKLRYLAHELGIIERVEFSPSLARQELYARISQSYLVVIPSWTDVSPHQVYELLSLGLPFLLTKENYLPLNTQDFLKIDPSSVDDIAEKLNRLLEPAEYAKLREQLQKLSFAWSWDDILKAHEQVFIQIR